MPARCACSLTGCLNETHNGSRCSVQVSTAGGVCSACKQQVRWLARFSHLCSRSMQQLPAQLATTCIAAKQLEPAPKAVKRRCTGKQAPSASVSQVIHHLWIRDTSSALDLVMLKVTIAACLESFAFARRVVVPHGGGAPEAHDGRASGAHDAIEAAGGSGGARQIVGGGAPDGDDAHQADGPGALEIERPGPQGRRFG